MVTRHCPHCSAANPAEARFCGNCGAPLPAPEESRAIQEAAVGAASPASEPASPVEERLEALEQTAKGLADSLEGVEEQLETTAPDAHESAPQATHARCPRCEADNPTEAQFCANCGSALAARSAL